MPITPQETIRNYLDAHDGAVEVPVHNLLTTWQLDDAGVEARTRIEHELAAAGVTPDRPLAGLGVDDRVRLSVASSAPPQATPSNGAGTASVLYGGRRRPIGPEGLSVGRDEDSDMVIPGESASRNHARVYAEDGAYWIEDLGSTNGTRLNGEHFGGTVRRLEPGDAITIGGETLRILAGEETRMASRELPIIGTQVVALDSDRLSIGRDSSNDVVLDDPNVSRFHAEVVATEKGHELRDLGSRNGTRVDGVPTDLAPLEPGTTIGVGPFQLVFDGSSFVARDDRGALRLDAEGVAVRVGEKQILAPTSVSVGPGEFVAIIGESGAGKSTLLKALAGVTEPSEGKVSVNGEPVRVRLTDIGYLPQDEIVHPLLTVDEALNYAARLRLPHDASAQEVEAAVRRVVDELALGEQSGNLIGSLSGGQRKRAGAGAELIHRPGLLFLDEPTTGLDPGLESRMMELLRKLADNSRGVAVVTHATKNLRLCDKLVVMGRGGELVFCGPPDEALEFFGVEDPDDIYKALEERPASEWRRTWEDSLEAPRDATVVGSVLPVPVPGRRRVMERRITTQARVLAHRYLRILLRDRRNMLLILGQAPVLALAIAGLFEAGVFAPSPEGRPAGAAQMLFLLAMTTIWLGSITAAREIVKERGVLVRESAVGMRLSAYLLSKTLVLFALVAVQTLALAGIAFLLRPLHEPFEVYAEVLGILLFTGFAAVALGLLISTIARNEDQAMTVVPLIMIPQLLFGGGIVPVEQIGQPLAAFSQVMFAQWSFAGVGTAVDMNGRIAADPEFARASEFGTSFFDLPLGPSLLILAAFLVAFLAAVAFLLRRGTS